jgi:hypothetical protein
MVSLGMRKGLNGLETRKATVALPVQSAIVNKHIFKRSQSLQCPVARDENFESQGSDLKFSSIAKYGFPGILFSSYISASKAWAVAEANDVTYNAAEASDFLKNAAGCAYVLLVGIFLYRVLSRRARRAREEVMVTQPDSTYMAWTSLTTL